MKKLAMVLVAVIIGMFLAVEARAFSYFGDVYGFSALSGVRVIVYQKMWDGAWNYWGEAMTYSSAEYQFDFPSGEFVLQYVADGWKSEFYNDAYDFASANVIRSPGGSGQEMLSNVYLLPVSVTISVSREVLSKDFRGEKGNFVVRLGNPGYSALEGEGFLVWVTREVQTNDNLQQTGIDLVGRKGAIVPLVLGLSRTVRIPYWIPADAARTTMSAWAHVAPVPEWVARVTNMTATRKKKFYSKQIDPDINPEEYSRIVRDAVFYVEAKAQTYWDNE